MKNFFYQVVNTLKSLALQVFFEFQPHTQHLQSETGWTRVERTIPVWVYAPYRDTRNLDLLQRLKYGHDEYAIHYCAELLVELIQTKKLHDYICISVPQSTDRARWRGYDHLQEVLDHVHTLIPTLPVAISPLVHISSTTQSELNREERFVNASRVFRVHEGTPATYFLNRKILLIDDIVTSGATLSHIQKLLYTLGAKEVIAIALWG